MNQNKWQANFFTTEIIRQLKGKPKVILQRCNVQEKSVLSSEESDQDHPDLSNVANFVECTTCETEIQTESSARDTECSLEAELDKMFGTCNDDNEPLNDLNKLKKVNSKSKQKISKKRNLREQLIRLFGSPLDDIVIEKITSSLPQKLNKNRRHSLPVSINILNEDFLKPLKVTKKRKSENDAVLLSSSSVCKISRTSLSTATESELPETEFFNASEFVKMEMDVENISSTPVTSETVKVVVVTDQPIVKEAEETEVVCNNIIDLTEEENPKNSKTVPLPMSICSTVKVEPSEPCQSSETADAPAPAPAPSISMPTLSPITPSETIQPEATLPETIKPLATKNSSEGLHAITSQGPPPNITITSTPPNKTVFEIPNATTVVPSTVPEISQNFSGGNNDGSPRTPSILQEIMLQCSAQRKQHLQTLQMIFPSGGGLYQNPNVVSTTQSHSTVPSVVTMSQPLPPKRQKQSQQRVISTKLPPVLPKNVSAMAATSVPQQRMSQIQPSRPSYQQWTQCPPAPKLIRLHKPTSDSYHLLSNIGFTEKIFPYFYNFTEWRQKACKFCENLQMIMSQNMFKENYNAFNLYAVHTMKTFGKRMIQDMQRLDVNNFNLIEIFHIISTKLQEKNIVMNNYRICIHFYYMLRECEGLCTTPFTQKFFKHINFAMAELETRTQLRTQGHSLPFPPHQLKRLELQINQYLLIRNWTNAQLKRINIQVSKVSQLQHQSQRQQQQQQQQQQQHNQKQNYAGPLRQILLQQIYQRSVPDRSGNSDNLSNTFNYSPNTITDSNQNANPQQKTNSETACTRPALQIVATKTPPTTKVNTSVDINSPPCDSLSVPDRNAKDCSAVECQNTRTNDVSTIEIVDLSEDLPFVKTETSKTTRNIDINDEVIDLTWIDDGDEAAMIEEMKNHEDFPFKTEKYENDASTREVVSPADSGLGSPRLQADGKDGFKCLCGENAIYVCACNSSMYCSRECQISDWVDHQKWCQEMKT